LGLTAYADNAINSTRAADGWRVRDDILIFFMRFHAGMWE